MPKRNDDLFERLRRAGVRKPVAKTLSELTGDAGKKAAGAGHRAIAELRALADEVEKRLPTSKSSRETPEQPAPVTTTRRRATPPATRASAKKAPAAQPKAPASGPKASTSRPRKTTAQPSTASKAPAAARGENKAKILAALKTGPYTASEVSEKTGIATATVSAALTRLAKSGEASKAPRGYSLPK